MKSSCYFLVAVGILLVSMAVHTQANTHGETNKKTDSAHKPAKLTDYAMVLHTTLLIITFIAGFFLAKREFKYLGEAGVGLLVGAVAGFILLVTHGTDFFSNLVKFDEHIFFIVLLPPIIFEAGYNMKRRFFFRNFGAICTYAFAGTFISTFIVGGLCFLVGQAGMAVQFTFLESMIFGALISATDPVTVLAVFSKLNADKDLFSFVFGESVLNDAVAIVLYRSFLGFKTEPFTGASCAKAVGTFFEIFIVSFIIGVGFSMALAYFCKKVDCEGNHDLEHAVTAAVALTPYIAYLAAEALNMSGIVTILFAGIAMAVFVRPNISAHSREFTSHLAKMLAHVFETYVFVYLGLALFTIDQMWDTAVMSIYAIIICLFARLCNIYPLSFLLNKFLRPKAPIDHKKQFAMWFAGLRGAIAFVLALQAKEDFATGQGNTILTTCILVIFFTVFVFGGYIWPLLERFSLRDPPDVPAHNPYHNAIHVINLANKNVEAAALEDLVDQAIDDLEEHASNLRTDIETLALIKRGESSRAERDELVKRLRELCHDFEDEDDSTWLGEVHGCLRPAISAAVVGVKRRLTTMPPGDDHVNVPMVQLETTHERDSEDYRDRP